MSGMAIKEASSGCSVGYFFTGPAINIFDPFRLKH